MDEIIVDLNNYEETITKLREDIGINLSYDFSIDDLENSYKYIKPGLELLEDKDKLIELIDIISYFQEKLMNIPNPDVLNLDFDKIQGQIDNLISEEKTIRINSSFINDNINHENIINDFMDHEKEIDSSNLKPALRDPDLINKLNLFKDKKDSFLGKRFNSNFKRCKQEFHQYYNFNVSDNQIIEDFDRIIQCDEELALLRNQISTYYKEFIDNREITLEYNKLTSWHNKVEAIKISHIITQLH